MSFDRARAPRQVQSGGDGVDVPVDAGGEGVEAGQVVLSDGVEPGREALALAVGEHGREGPDVEGEGVEFGALSADGLELELRARRGFPGV
ncbi:hypothetical protein ACIGD1_34240 [Streptomyces sp. NPDC085612]|uniref:hypothetical protein n=1 Tax=Streptomyces sp. NPDC085612 TaxID=3365732 RepID=UPI0037D4A306